MKKDEYEGYSDSQEWRVNNPKKVILHLAKQRSKKRGIEFSITENDFEIPSHCPVLGIELKHNRPGARSRGSTNNSPTLDRINPDLGYIPGNVVIISKRANQIKSNAKYEDIQRVLKWLKTVLKSIDRYTYTGSLKA